MSNQSTSSMLACSEQNLLLNALPEAELADLSSHSELVELKYRQILLEPDQAFRFAFFVCSGLVSVMAVMHDGSSVEIVSVGREGMVGLPAVLGSDRSCHRCQVQVSGSAWRVPISALQKMHDRSLRLQGLLRQYLQARFFAASQLQACNALHSVEQRLARWLLSAQDRVQAAQLSVTHESLSEILGAQRSTVTVAAGRLESAGLIFYKRGLVQIVNRHGLERSSCECYTAAKKCFHDALVV